MPPDLMRGYGAIQAAIFALLETARKAVARNINAAMTATYWEIGRRIVEFEQGGADRATYGDALVERLANDLTQRFGRGFSRQNLGQMRAFYRAWPGQAICQTLSGKSSRVSILEAISSESAVSGDGRPWLHEPDSLSRVAKDALVQHLADFLLELGDDFAFVGRQRRLRLDDTWFRIDLLFFHRRLKCLLVIDLKAGKFSHTDAGQMHLYLNYASEHWVKPGENPPVGLIICTAKGVAEAHYALEGLQNRVLAAEYLTVLPDEKLLAEELVRTRRQIGVRSLPGGIA
jgi:hypothetical protein